MAKRADGALEHEVLAVLWAADRSLLPSEVRERLEPRLAYTSVATVLSRLLQKGLVGRTAAGRGFRYAASLDEAELAARRMNATLLTTSDHDAVLAHFVERLSSREASALQALLERNT